MSVAELRQLKRGVDSFTDEELEGMSWRELEKLAGIDFSTIKYRVSKKGMSRREACTLKTHHGLSLVKRNSKWKS